MPSCPLLYNVKTRSSSEELYGISPDSEKEDPSGEGSHGHLGIRTPVQTSLTEVSEKDHGHQTPKLTVK